MNTFNTDMLIIVDGAHSGSRKFKDEEEYKYNKAFMKSFGLKTDSVGWAEVSSDSFSEDDFNRLIEQAQKEHVRLRCYCDIQSSTDMEADWYAFQTRNMETDALVFSSNGFKDSIPTVEAWRYKPGFYTTFSEALAVREDVISILEEAGIAGCSRIKWLPDTGRYESRQFFYCNIGRPEGRIIDWTIHDDDLRKRNKEWRESFSTFIKKYSDLIAVAMANDPSPVHIEMIELPLIAERSAFSNAEIIDLGNGIIGVNKKTKGLLAENRIISSKDIEPVLLVDNITELIPDKFLPDAFGDKPHYFRKVQADKETCRQEVEKLHNKLMENPRPAKKASEKMALARVKEEKKNSPEFFNKGARGRILDDVYCEAMQPYYKISNGFNLSDEYYIYSIAEQREVAEQFKRELEEEELFTLQEEYHVIGQAADGEYIVLLNDGSVVLIQMGNPEYTATWSNLNEFFFTAD